MTEAKGIQKVAVFVERVAIRNFRGIQELDLRLQPGLTLLVGRNNAGKSRILRALHLAMGGARAERDDLTVGSNSDARIDIVIAPRPSPSQNGEGASPSSKELKGQVEEFDRSVSLFLGPLVTRVSIDPPRQRFAWRTTITSTSEDTGARSQSYVMTYSQNDGWNTSESSVPLNRQQRRILVAELVDTQRHLDRELRQPGSALRKILNDLNVPEDKREGLENRLAELGDDIVEQSGTLQELHTALETLDRYLDAMGTAKVDAVPGSLEELARTVGVSFDTGQGQVAARLQGSGVRSLASLQVQDLFYRLRLGSDGPDLRPHIMTLVEEPEAHLHPHAIFELPVLLESQDHQIVATTHSPQLVTVVEPEAIRLIREISSGRRIIDSGPAETVDNNTPHLQITKLDHSEIEQLKRQVERPFGDLLFARAIVIGDGATERAFLPPVLRNALGTLAHGISVVDSGGIHTPLTKAVIKFAQSFEVPFILLADNDSEGRKNVKNLKEILSLSAEQIVWMSSLKDDQKDKDNPPKIAFEKMMIKFDLDLCKRVCQYLQLPYNDESTVFESMKSAKGYIGKVLAEEFVKHYPHKNAESKWPETLKELVKKLHQQLGNSDKELR